jgi:transcriptional regulator with XRE-family HTH domain
MRRLIVRDLRESPPPGIAVFHVLERPPFRVGKEEIHLKAGVQDDLSRAFLPARDFGCMRFWIDVEHELGANLRDLLTPDERGFLRAYAEQAKTAAALVIEARRVALGMRQDELASEIDVSLDRVAGIETGTITINPTLLNCIEVSFAIRESAKGFTPHETSSWLARQISEARGPRNGSHVNEATPVRSSPVSVKSAPTRLSDLPMLVEPPESEDHVPSDTSGGTALREERKTRRMSLVNFAATARMQPTHLSRLERGYLNMTPEVQERIKLTHAYLDARRPRVLS